MKSILISQSEWQKVPQQVENIISSDWPVAQHFLLPAQHHEVYCSAHKRRGPEITEKGSERTSPCNRAAETQPQSDMPVCIDRLNKALPCNKSWTIYIFHDVS